MATSPVPVRPPVRRALVYDVSDDELSEDISFMSHPTFDNADEEREEREARRVPRAQLYQCAACPFVTASLTRLCRHTLQTHE